MIFSSMEHMIKWVSDTLKVPCSTKVPRDTPDIFTLLDRTGGTMDYPHDSPEYTVSIWAKSKDACEQLAHELAIALKLTPPADRHINHVDVPNVFSYGVQDGGYTTWQVTFQMQVNIQNEEV